MEDNLTPKEQLTRAMASLDLTVESTFVPWSKSRNFKPNTDISHRSLNWKITLKREGRDVLATDYSSGIAHCPSYKAGRMSVETANALQSETEHGRAYAATIRGKTLNPDPTSVIHSLIMDSDVIDHANFESWAADTGYDTDSRSAERTYQACLKIALALRASIGETGLQKLRDAAQDY